MGKFVYSEAQIFFARQAFESGLGHIYLGGSLKRIRRKILSRFS